MNLNPTDGALDKKTGSIQRGGIRLFYVSLIPSHAKAMVLVIHGINDHKGRYLKLQEDLADAGFGSIAYDQRGFGASGGRRCDVSHYQEYHADLKGVLTLLRETLPDKPLFILGHSLGGAIAATFCIDFPLKDFPDGIAGLILSSPAYEVPTLPFGLEGLVGLLSRLWPTAAVPYPDLHHKRSHDPAIAPAVRADPLILVKATPRFYMQFRLMNRYFQAHADQIDFPTLILQAGADAIVTPEGAKVLYGQLENPAKKLIWYDGFYHEVFNEIEGKRVVADLIQWLNVQVP